ncbi:hypothetical protein J7K24_02725 [bacterium]|nr:hypothetical protein [bacterium]
MLEIKPDINKNASYYRCPLCGSEILIKNFFIVGMRNIVEFKCKSCGKEFLSDLPARLGFAYQATIDKESLEIKEAGRKDWAEEMVESYKKKNEKEIKITHKVFKESKNIILVNCLDGCYGHSIWALLDCARYIKKFRETFGICLMIPYQLQHLVPEGVSELLLFYLPFREYRKWYSAINKKIHSIVDNKERVYLASNIYSFHPTSYDISLFPILRRRISSQNKTKSIVFSYREDGRTWGLTPWLQKRNIEKLFTYLKDYYKNIRFVLCGLGKKEKFRKDIIDFREEKFNLELEKKWIEEYKRADSIIGVHGSHMNLPSVLARNVINLIPEYKYYNALRDMRYPVLPPLANFHKFRFIYGNNFLSDVSPRKLFKILVYQLELEEKNVYFSNLKDEPKINNIEELKKRKEKEKSIPKDVSIYLKLSKYSFIDTAITRFPVLKKIRRILQKL